MAGCSCLVIVVELEALQNYMKFHGRDPCVPIEKQQLFFMGQFDSSWGLNRCSSSGFGYQNQRPWVVQVTLMEP